MPDPLLSIVSVVLCCLNIYVRSLQVGKLRPGEMLDTKVRFVLSDTKLAFDLGIVFIACVNILIT